MIETFWLVLGYGCNNRCGGCYASPGGFSTKKMNSTFAKDTMEILRGGGVENCLLIGGEPTLYPYLEDILSFGTGIGLKMIIVSNGRKFKNIDLTKRLFENGLEKVVVSLNGADSSVHDKLTGRHKSFAETAKGIENCAKIGKVSTLTTICRINADKIIETMKFAVNLGAAKAVLNCSVPVVSDNGVNAEHSLEPDLLAKVVEKVIVEANKQDIPFQINATFPLCLMEQSVLFSALKEDQLSVGCHMYRGKGVVFDPFGNILPCTHFVDFPIFENIYSKGGDFKIKDNFWMLWKSPKSEAGKFRKDLWRYPVERCQECESWGACVGGCPLLWSYYDPAEYIK